MQRRLVKALEDLVTHYDGSVRNSRGDIIQFIYGDDGLDPVHMEEDGIPANFERVFTSITFKRKTNNGSSDDEMMEIEEHESDYLKVAEFKAKVNNRLDKWCTESSLGIEYINKLRDFLDNLAKRLDFSERLNVKYDRIQVLKISHYQLNTFLDICYRKYMQSKLDPGTAIGALAAQSMCDRSKYYLIII